MYKKLSVLLIFISINMMSMGQALSAANVTQQKAAVKKFTLTAIYFNEVDLIDNFELFPFYERYLGASIEIATLRQICNDITQYYQSKGFEYARCTLPYQKIQDGVVTLHIIEGVIGAVSIEGDVDKDDSLINSYLDQIELNKPVNDSQLHTIVHLLNAVPGLSVQVFTRAIPYSKKLELVFDIQQKNFDGEIYANNRGSRVIGPVQAGMSLASYSLLGVHEYLRLHLLATKETDELKFVEVNTSWPIGSQGAQLVIESSYANSKPGDFLQPAEINVDVSTGSVGWSKPVLITATDSFLFTAALDYYRSDTEVSNSRVALDDLYKARLSFDYVVSSRRHYTRTNITLKVGIKDLNTTEISSNATTSGFVSTGREDFSAVKFDFFSRVSLLKNLYISNQVQGQYAFRDLPVSEDIVFGGDAIGSAYDPAELFGDHGLGGSSRITYQLEEAWINSGYTQFYLQYDIAKIWNNVFNIISSEASLAAGLSIGSGDFYLDLQVAKPLTKNVLLEGNKDSRFFANAHVFF